ncbi:RHS repeat-associated core domain-containing protein, partial [Draconibacterium sp. IB214405]|uniref:RHS repeat domain-containing protein n=1 Tax=Draconibacterium sp. IB214405 TaxID=3097352 RepID=UPI002A0AF05B
LDNNPVIVNYKTNSTAISSWRYTGSSYSSVSFPAESLFLTETTDEDGKVSKQYTDFEGKLVQTEINGLRTAYCYDEHGLLRAVVQPKGSSPASTSSCFLYKYDDKNRMVEKWIPGKGWEYFVYDDRNRVVLIQDGNLNADDKWQYTIYDGLNRPTEQGIWSSTSSRETLANAVESNIDYMEGRTSRVAYKYLSYDDYSMSDEIALGSDAGTLGESQASDNTGRLTMEKTILLDYESGMDTWITNTYYYDKYGRLIQTAKDNHLMGKDYITNAYNFAGLVEQSRYRHTADGTTTYVDQYTDYDHRGRVMKVRHRINGGTEVLLTGNNYNEAGSLVDKYLHSVSNGTFLQRMDYSYNIRGWLIQINSPTSFTENDKFGMQLYYNSSPSGGSAMYNGNISGINWGTPSNTNMLYRFTYDGSNRLTNADFYNSSYSTYALDASYGYDNNGNLEDINRRNGSGTYIDQIDITYTGNQISTIKDLSGDASSTVDYPGSSTAQSFAYDANGNVTHENHKLTITDYNLLNLPREINWSGQNKYVNYFYTFDGEKLRKTVENSGTITKMDYCGIFVYETNSGTRSLKYIITPEGRAVKNGSSWDYEYNLKDHLGNVRAVIDDAGVLVQERHYYPFGMEMSSLSSGSSTNKYQYNGKELENDFDLGYYDYGARFYDPQLGRWHSVDPMADAEHNFSFSPYNYVVNNPMIFIDPNGEDWYDVNGTITWHDQEGELTIGDQTYQSLGKNVLVGTHNRDADGNEDVNSATFSLYLESNTEGASATIEGNTVPGDIEKFGTLAEGIYDADYAEYKGKPALLIGKGGDLPTTNGNPNNPDNYNADGTLKPTSEHVMDEIFFHKGNVGRERLWYQKPNGKKGFITEGCQTGPNKQNSLPLYLNFMKNVDKSFSGKYYLRRRK